MSSSAIQEILEEIEELLASAGDLASEVELAVEKLLNVVEALSSDKQSLIDEVERLKQQQFPVGQKSMNPGEKWPLASAISDNRRLFCSC